MEHGDEGLGDDKNTLNFKTNNLNFVFGALGASP